ncbi:MAG TPA: metallophosphoesterase [Cytophagales bacterium]|nr:metallophosphoesterase [Cytophagales bacterium]
MEKNKDKVRVAAVGDIHVGEGDHGKWVDYFRKISEQADVLLLCGDLTDHGYAKEAEVLCDELKSCSIPVVAVLGNHDYEKDEQEEIKRILNKENVHILDGDSIELGKVGIAGVKGFGGGFDRHMLPKWGEKMNKSFVQEVVDESLKLDQALARLDGDNLKKIAIMHYSPISATIVGEPEQIFPFLGSSYLAEPLERRDVVAAFHGHAHIGTLSGETSKGVKVYNVSKPILMRAGFDPAIFILEL